VLPPISKKGQAGTELKPLSSKEFAASRQNSQTSLCVQGPAFLTLLI